MITTFSVSAEVVHLDVQHKPGKTPSAVAIVRYGPAGPPTADGEQLQRMSLIRIPRYVYERCADSLTVGSMVDVFGHMAEVPQHILGGSFKACELVADKLTVTTPS